MGDSENSENENIRLQNDVIERLERERLERENRELLEENKNLKLLVADLNRKIDHLEQKVNSLENDKNNSRSTHFVAYLLTSFYQAFFFNCGKSDDDLKKYYKIEENGFISIMPEFYSKVKLEYETAEDRIYPNLELEDLIPHLKNQLLYGKMFAFLKQRKVSVTSFLILLKIKKKRDDDSHFKLPNFCSNHFKRFIKELLKTKNELIFDGFEENQTKAFDDLFSVLSN
jgi:hypothetical protein